MYFGTHFSSVFLYLWLQAAQSWGKLLLGQNSLSPFVIAIFISEPLQTGFKKRAKHTHILL
jgi:hypothetical protein